MTLNGTTYAKGLGDARASDVRYASAAARASRPSVGVDDEVGANGSVVFEVYADATKVYDSGLMTGATATKTIDVSVAGASELRLVVTTAAPTSLRPRRLGARADRVRRRLRHDAAHDRPSDAGARRDRRRPGRLSDRHLFRGDEPRDRSPRRPSRSSSRASRRRSSAGVSYAVATPRRSTRAPTCTPNTTYTATVKGGARARRTSPATRSPPTRAGPSRRQRRAPRPRRPTSATSPGPR